MNTFFKIAKYEFAFLKESGFSSLQYQKANEMELVFEAHDCSMLLMYDEFCKPDTVELIVEKGSLRENLLLCTDIFSDSTLHQLKNSLENKKMKDQIKIYADFVAQNLTQIIA